MAKAQASSCQLEQTVAVWNFYSQRRKERQIAKNGLDIWTIDGARRSYILIAHGEEYLHF